MKRRLSLFLAILMIISVMCASPVSISAETTEAQLISVYFENNWLWTDVFYHSWGSSLDTNTAWGEGKPELVGTTEAGNEIYKAVIGSDATGIVFAGTKNDGTGAVDQTPDINENIYDGVCYSMTWNNGNAVVANDISTILPDLNTDPEEPAETYTVYFADYPDSFETAYAYAWTTGADGDVIDTVWPGKEMTPTGEVLSDGGIVYSCTFDAMYENIIFNDGTQQTAELTFTPDRYLWWGNECWYESLEVLEAECLTPSEPSTGDEEEPSSEYIRIYFQNNWLWNDINIYFWGSTTYDNPTWPGVAMEYADNDGTYDIYYCDVPADITGMVINGTKDDGTGAVDQTPDITEGWYDGICYYMTWSDGNTVGSEDITVILPDSGSNEPTADLKGYSISLEGNIGVSFYFDLSTDVYEDADAVVRFAVPNTGTTTTLDIPVSEGEYDGATGYFKFTCYVAAKEMTSVIRAQVITTVIETEEHEYTVKDYAVYMLEHADFYADEQDLVKALLNYGAASQVHFGYNTDSLANDTEYMTDADREIPVKNHDYFAPVIEGEAGDVVFYGATLSLKSETALKFYFRIDNPVSDSMAITVNGIHGASLTKNGNLYMFTIENLCAHQLGDVYTLETDGQTIKYSALSYVYLAQQSDDVTLADVANALSAYYEAVSMYGSN